MAEWPPTSNWTCWAKNNVTQGLLEDYIIFDFVNEWVITHPTIDSVAEFHFRDWDKFQAYLTREDFDFKSKAEQLLEDAAARAKEEGYDITPELASIQAETGPRAGHGHRRTARRRSPSIIEKEIAGRYYYQRGQVQMGLRNDKEVQEAIAVLNDRARYDAILSK